MIISFTGCDGAGKSTQISRISDLLIEQGYQVKIIDKWNILNHDIFPECRFINQNLNDLRVCIAQMEGISRAMFLFWTIMITLSKENLNDSNVIFLLDGYWMKHAASEILYGCESEWIEKTVRQFPTSDLTIYFDITPEVSAERKQEFTPYECGRVQNYNVDDFIRHQTRLRELMLSWAGHYKWEIIPSILDRDELTSLIISLISEKLENRKV